MDWLTLVIVLSATTYRFGRLVALDTIFTPWRSRLFPWLERGSKPMRSFVTMLGCPWCITVWIAVISTLIVDWGLPVPFVDWGTDVSVPLPFFTAFAVATGSLVFWGILDSDRDPAEAEAKRRAALEPIMDD